MSRAFITLGADVGGRDADDVTNAHVLAFRRLLADSCQGSYSETIKEIALVLRIDGSVKAWGKRGIEGVAIRTKGTFATADIYLPRDVWASEDISAFKSFLTSQVKSAIAQIAERAKLRGLDLLREDLEHDVHEACLKFTEN